MYSKIDSTWLKHWDFILLDMLMIQIAYVFSYIIRMGLDNPYKNQLYLSIGVILCLADICVAFFTEPYHGIMRRGYFIEFNNTLKHVFFVSLLEVCFLFLTQNGAAFSRLSFVWFFCIAVVLVYCERLIWKHYLISHKQLFYDKVKMLVVTPKEQANELISRLLENRFNEFEIVGISYTDSKITPSERIQDIPVVCMADEIPDYIQTKWVDSVFVKVNDRIQLPAGLLEKCIDMGVTVHTCLEGLEEWTGNQYINRMGGYTVLTSSVRVVSSRQTVMKRILDICGGLVGR